MSSIEYFKMASERFTGVIHPQITQLLNTYTTNYINTGDRVKDGALIIIVNCLLSLVLSGFYYLFQYINLNMILKNKYEIDCIEVLKNTKKDEVEKYEYCYTCSVSFLDAILKHQINNKIMEEVKYVKQANYVMCCNGDLDNKTKYTFELDCSNFVELYLPIHKYVNKRNEIEYIYCISNKFFSKSGVELKKFLDRMINIWDYAKVNTKDKIYIYEIQFNEATYEKKEIGKVKNITFDNIHFKEKALLLEWLNKFEKRKLYPQKLGISNKIGILLYGPPGTGKTGCISALANYLKRDIININSLDISNIQLLTRCFETNKKSSIFVFDEFDYLLNINDNKSADKINYQEMLLYAQDDKERQSILEMMRKNKKDSKNQIDTSFLIKLLDGIADDSERCIIATTNNPDKINKLFLRPGRFDLKLKLGYCTFDMFVDIVKTKYEEMETHDFENEKIRIHPILLKNISPLVLINNLITSTTFENLLYLLSQLGQSEYEKEC